MTFDLAKLRFLRHLVLITVRLVAAILLLVGTHALINALLNAFPFRGLTDLIIFWDEGFSWLGRALGILLPGVVLAIWSRRIARWIVPVPRNECPECGYQLQHLTTQRCPECGLVFRAAASDDVRG